MHSNGQPPESVFGAHVKRLRDELGIPPSALTGALRLSDGIELEPGALALLEQGERPISLDEAVAFARVLDMTVDEMLQPTSPLEERLNQAQHAVAHATLNVAEAMAALETAQARLAQLEALTARANDD